MSHTTISVGLVQVDQNGFFVTQCNKCKMHKKTFISNFMINFNEQYININVPTWRTGLKMVKVKLDQLTKDEELCRTESVKQISCVALK